jgi:hypothetical protein
MNRGIGFRSEEGFKRMLKGIRDAETLRKSPPQLPLAPLPNVGPAVVSVRILSDTPVDGYYPGVFRYRNVESVSEGDNWFDHEWAEVVDSECFVQEVNSAELEENKNYLGYVAGLFNFLNAEEEADLTKTYNGFPLVMVTHQYRPDQQFSVSGMTDVVCLMLEVISASGNCATLNQNQVLYLEHTTGETWVSTANFIHNGGNSAVTFVREAPIPTVTIGAVEGFFVGYDDGGIIYDFGGATLCAGVGCDSGFRIKLTCVTCPSDTDVNFTLPGLEGGGEDGNDPSYQYIVPPGEQENFQFVVEDLAPGENFTYVYLHVVAPDGLDETQFQIVAPDGTTSQFIINYPPDLTGDNFQQYIIGIVLDETQTQYQLVAANDETTLNYQLPQFIVEGDDTPNFQIPLLTMVNVADDNFLYQYSIDNPGQENGNWQLVVNNDSEEAVEILQFSFVYGSPASGLTIEATPTPTAGGAPLTVSLDWTITGNAAIVRVDWDDGTIEFFHPTQKPKSHTYSGSGSYEIITRAYSLFGSYAETTDIVTVGSAILPGATCGDGGDIPSLPNAINETTDVGVGTSQWYRYDIPGTPPFDVLVTVIGVDGTSATVFIYHGPDCDNLSEIDAFSSDDSRIVNVNDDFMYIEVYNAAGGEHAYQLQFEAG